ncbi:MAG: hypothetical protein OEY30_04330, partial [Candidatus Bathyarchaeota archaeon]|nr:hypothetical protein [Candidatus Bathyarchaeota archaeon]
MSENKMYGTDMLLLVLLIGVIIGGVCGSVLGAVVVILSAAETAEPEPPEITSVAGTVIRIESTLLNRREVDSYTKAVPLFSFLYVVDLENGPTISFVRGGEFCLERDVNGAEFQ